MAGTDSNEDRGTAKKTGIRRRSFLKWIAALAAGTALIVWGLFPKKSRFVQPPARKTQGTREKLIYLAIDGLHPGYLELDAGGYPGGSDGNYLMPNVHAFLQRSLWYRNARAFLPAATDMNHLNALAGTSTAQTGIVSVWA